MRVLGLTLLLMVPGVAGDPAEDGVRFYKQGKYAEAVAAFRAALVENPDSARLNYNLALALWRKGEADAAETAAEKAAALADGGFDSLRDGILGNLRYDKARAIAATAGKDPQKEVDLLEQAVQLAGTARQHFQDGSIDLVKRDPDSGSEMLRNLERAIKLEEELKRRLEEAEKKREEQKKKDDQKNKKNDKQKQDKKTEDPDENKKSDDPENQDDEKQKEPPDPEQKDKEKKNDEKEDEKPNQPHDAPKPQEVPGEHDSSKELSPEQRRQLLKMLEEFEKKLRQIKAARKAARPKVKKDW